ncbi:hypothetical protein ABZ154_15395 [Streptomyces sp. NPDC006261]|uniref:hypothetical protein n=1 Tax=Streptomyces sp. NPDC006261 TaxID=3156739 RepID=UPI0033B14A76
MSTPRFTDHPTPQSCPERENAEAGRSGRIALYRYLDTNGNPLYIGITSHPEDRQKAHARAPWAQEAASLTTEWYDTDAEASAAEIVAIRTERPIYNDAENFDRVPAAPTTWPSLATAGPRKAAKLVELIRAEIDKGNWPTGHKIPAPRDLAAAVEIGLGATNHAIQLLRQQRYVYRYKSFGYFVCERDHPAS